MKTMVEVFSQLTPNELSGYSLYEDVLGNHLEKFREFYYITKLIPADLEKAVKGIDCFCKPDGLHIVLKFSSTKKCKEYMETIEPNLVPDNEEYFTFNIKVASSKKLNISLENNKISREDEIYEDRFNTN